MHISPSIVGFHVMSEKSKIKNFEFLPSSGKRYKDISAGLFSDR